MIGHNSNVIKPENIQRVVDFLFEYPELVKSAKKAADRTEWLARVLLAELTMREQGKSHAEREGKAMLQDQYKNAKEAEINAKSEEVGVKAQFAANEMLASLYQTQSANNRSTKV